MIRLYDGQISDLLANGAKHNPEIKALSYAVLKEKRRIIDHAQRTRTLAMIDELPETILDILAVELRTPFYQEDFSLKTKRALIKDTLIYYTYMGTPEAVNRMLSAVFPGSYIEEWYTYGGEPCHFQIILEMSDYRECADAAAIIKGIKKVKRLTAHLDGLVYQCNIGIIIETHGHGYKYKSRYSGQVEAGTEPWRNKRGGFEHEELEIEITATGAEYHSPATGTKPWRDVLGGLEHDELEIQSSGRGWEYTSKSSGEVEAGTEPWRNKKGGCESETVKLETDAQGFGYKADPAGTKPKRSTLLRNTDGELDILSERTPYGYTSTLAGQIKAGTEPWRNRKGGSDKEAVRVETDAEAFSYKTDAAGTEPKRSITLESKDAGLEFISEGKPSKYSSSFTGRTESGTVPLRAQEFANEENSVQLTASAEGFIYSSELAGQTECGTEPQRNAKGGELSGAFFTTAEAESYRYRITMCGTSYCKNKRRRSLC